MSVNGSSWIRRDRRSGGAQHRAGSRQPHLQGFASKRRPRRAPEVFKRLRKTCCPASLVLAQFRPKVAIFCRDWPKSTKLGGWWSNFAKLGPTLAFSPVLANVGQIRPNRGQFWPNSGSCSTIVGRNLVKSRRPGQLFEQVCATF